MSARAALAFQTVFDGFAAAIGFTAAQVAANPTLQNKLLQIFNRVYTRGYTKRSWEDAWDGEEVTPASRLIAFSVIDDARLFEVWSDDPRDDANNAFELRYSTTLNGILLSDDADTAFVLSMPKAPKFTTTAWASGTTYAAGALALYTDGNVYRSLQGSNTNKTPTSEAAWWVAVPVLAVLEEFTIAYARGTYLLENGQIEAGAAERSDAMAALDDLARTEYCRTAANAWKPKY